MHNIDILILLDTLMLTRMRRAHSFAILVPYLALSDLLSNMKKHLSDCCFNCEHHNLLCTRGGIQDAQEKGSGSS